MNILITILISVITAIITDILISVFKNKFGKKISHLTDKQKLFKKVQLINFREYSVKTTNNPEHPLGSCKVDIVFLEDDKRYTLLFEHTQYFPRFEFEENNEINKQLLTSEERDIIRQFVKDVYLDSVRLDTDEWVRLQEEKFNLLTMIH